MMLQSKSVIDFDKYHYFEIRSIRSELRFALFYKIKLLVLNDVNDYLDVLIENNIKIQRMARVSAIEYADAIPDHAIQFRYIWHRLWIRLKGSREHGRGSARLEKELGKILDDLAVVDKKLGNKQFLDNAPHDVIEKQRALREELSDSKMN